MIRALVISDGRPGHFRKTESLLNAIGKTTALNDKWIKVPTHGWIRRNLDAALMNVQPEIASRFFSGWLAEILGEFGGLPDLVVSTGANTLFQNALVAFHIGCPNVFIGNLRRYRPKLFWRVVTMDRNLKQLPGFCHLPWVMAGVAQDRLAKSAAEISHKVGENNGPLWGMLVGGDGAGYRFSDREMSRLSQLMEKEHRRNGVRWLIATSRRTGEPMERALVDSVNRSAVALLSPWSSASGGDYFGILGVSERIVCTDDSQMMIAEAIATGKPVVSLIPDTGKARSDAVLDNYCRHDLLSRITVNQALEDGIRWPTGGFLPVQQTEQILGELALEIKAACESRSKKS